MEEYYCFGVDKQPFLKKHFPSLRTAEIGRAEYNFRVLTPDKSKNPSKKGGMDMKKKISQLEEIRKNLNVNKKKMSKKLDVELETYKSWLTEEKINDKDEEKIDDLLEALEYEYLHCKKKDLFFRHHPEDPFVLDSSAVCPICERLDCEWEYEPFEQAFSFENIESSSLWVEDKRIVPPAFETEPFRSEFGVDPAILRDAIWIRKKADKRLLVQHLVRYEGFVIQMVEIYEEREKIEENWNTKKYWVCRRTKGGNPEHYMWDGPMTLKELLKKWKGDFSSSNSVQTTDFIEDVRRVGKKMESGG